MYAEVNGEYIGLTIVLLLIYSFLFAKIITKKKECERQATGIVSIAKMQTQLLGSYDHKLSVSVFNWLYGIASVLYEHDPGIDSILIYFTWNEEFNEDPDNLIYDAIQEVKTRMCRDADIAREKKGKIVFGVSPEFNYRNVSKTIKYSDYLNEEALMCKVSELLEDGTSI